MQNIKSTRLRPAIPDCCIIDPVPNTVPVRASCILMHIIKCKNCPTSKRASERATDSKKEGSELIDSVTSTGRHPRLARDFIKSRLINYARSTSFSATRRADFSTNLQTCLIKQRLFIRRRIVGKYADAFNRRAHAFKKFLLPRLILLPESQRIKHDTRTIALHDHQVTFTLSSHPLAVYPVQRRSAKEESRSERAKARKLSSCGNSRV